MTGEQLMQASGKLLVLDRLLERLFKLESRALIFSTFTQVMAAADGHLRVGTDCHLLAASDGPRIAPLHASAQHGASDRSLACNRSARRPPSRSRPTSSISTICSPLSSPSSRCEIACLMNPLMTPLIAPLIAPLFAPLMAPLLLP
jgi:hypothetical protein